MFTRPLKMFFNGLFDGTAPVSRLTPYLNGAGHPKHGLANLASGWPQARRGL